MQRNQIIYQITKVSNGKQIHQNFSKYLHSIEEICGVVVAQVGLWWLSVGLWWLSVGLWWLSGRAPGYKSCGPQFNSRAIPTVPKNFLGTVKWQVKIVQRQHMS